MPRTFSDPKKNPHYSAFWNRVGFAIGTGRCGTHCLAQLMSLESAIASTHERHPFNDTFHRYCKWYGLPIDAGGFIQTKAIDIEKDLEHHSFSFEASAYLSLSIVEVYQYFRAKFLVLVRSPEKVVNSYIRKGWYQQPYSRYNSSHIPSYQTGMKTHHFLGRIIPSGSAFEQWQQMTQVGKLAWYWNTLNSEIVEQLQNIPSSHWYLIKIEELDYPCYQAITHFLGFQTQITLDQFEAVVNSRPGSKPNVPSVADWLPIEHKEFEREVHSMSQYFAYR